MARPKRSLMEAFRDPDPESVVRARKKKLATKRVRKRAKVKGKRAKKKPPAKKLPAKKARPTWPEGWVVGTVRCHGLTAKGTQCNRRAKPPKRMCGAHKGLTLRTVLKALAAQVRDPSVGSPGHRPESDRQVRPEKKRRAGNIQDVPEDRLCQKMLYVNTGREKRCSGWTIEIEDGAYDDYCVTHSKHPRAQSARKRSHEKGRAGLETRNDYNAAAKRPIFNGEMKSQDDVAAARIALLRKLEVGGIGAANANAMLGALKDVSQHIERYGTHQGAEGGAGVLRLLPGSTLVEMQTELDTVLTKEDLEKIEEGLAKDEKAGVPTPTEFDEIILKYLGIQTRKRDKTRAQIEADKRRRRG